jgi:hypothetical protein
LLRVLAIFKEIFHFLIFFKEGICVQQNIIFPKKFKQNGEKFATKKNTGTQYKKPATSIRPENCCPF